MGYLAKREQKIRCISKDTEKIWSNTSLSLHLTENNNDKDERQHHYKYNWNL